MKKLVMLFVAITCLATFTLTGCDQSKESSEKGATGAPGAPAPAPEN